MHVGTWTGSRGWCGRPGSAGTVYLRQTIQPSIAMRRPPMLLFRNEALGQHSVLPSHAGLFVPATSPVATVIAGHLSHRVITRAPTIFLAKPLARLARRPLWHPATTGYRACSRGTPHRECNVPRRARRVVTGRCASDRPPGPDPAVTPHGRVRASPAAPLVSPIGHRARLRVPGKTPVSANPTAGERWGPATACHRFTIHLKSTSHSSDCTRHSHTCSGKLQR